MKILRQFPVLIIVSLVVGVAPLCALPKDDPMAQLQMDLNQLKTTVTELQKNLEKLSQKDDASQNQVGSVIELVRASQTTIQSSVQKMTDSLAAALKANSDKSSGDIRELTNGLKSLQDGLAQVTRKIGDLQARLEEKPAKSAKDFYNSAFLDLQQGHWTQAAEQFQEIVTKYPDNALAVEAQVGFADALVGQNKMIEAIIAYDTVSQKYPNSEKSREALYKKALAQLKEDDRTAAIDTLTKVIGDYPNTNEANNAAAKIKELKTPTAQGTRR